MRGLVMIVLCAVALLALAVDANAQCANTNSVSAANLQLGALALPQAPLFVPGTAASATARAGGRLVLRVPANQPEPIQPGAAAHAASADVAALSAQVQQLTAILGALTANQAGATTASASAGGGLALDFGGQATLDATGGCGAGGCSVSRSFARSGTLLPRPFLRRNVSRSFARTVTRN